MYLAGSVSEFVRVPFKAGVSYSWIASVTFTWAFGLIKCVWYQSFNFLILSFIYLLINLWRQNVKNTIRLKKLVDTDIYLNFL